VSSSARAIERAGPRLTGRAGALLVAITLLVMLALVPVRTFLDQRGQITELERRTLALQVQNSVLRRDIAELRDPAELERIARECLGMVGPGETALIVPGSDRDHADC
jgi:cell division protein FtsB